jgi:hypothetical protein
MSIREKKKKRNSEEVYLPASSGMQILIYLGIQILITNMYLPAP